MEQKHGQAPDLNNLQPNPGKTKIDLARAADAAYAAEHPSTPGQITAASGEGAPDLASMRQRLRESKLQDTEQTE